MYLPHIGYLVFICCYCFL